MFLVPFHVQDIVDTHPGLTFLKDAPEFHSRYITTVSNVARNNRLENLNVFYTLIFVIF